MSYTQKILKAFLKSKPFQGTRKQTAIYRIKMQPFYGKPLFDNMGDTIAIRRPAEYMEVKR